MEEKQPNRRMIYLAILLVFAVAVVVVFLQQAANR